MRERIDRKLWSEITRVLVFKENRLECSLMLANLRVFALRPYQCRSVVDDGLNMGKKELFSGVKVLKVFNIR